MAKYFLVSCVSQKASKPLPLKDLYTSPLFVKARNFVEKDGANWFILSAKYDLASPTAIHPPYNETLNKMKAADRRAWASRVLAALNSVVRPGDEVVFLAGEKYREHLEGPLREMGISVSVPMKGLGIGQQMSWLDREVA